MLKVHLLTSQEVGLDTRRSNAGAAAVHAEILAGDHSIVIGEQEERRVRDLLHLCIQMYST